MKPHGILGADHRRRAGILRDSSAYSDAEDFPTRLTKINETLPQIDSLASTINPRG